MVVTNTESVLQVVAVVSPGGTGVSVSVSIAETASVTSTSVANVTVTLVVPVMGSIIVSMWVLMSVWSPSEVISSIDLSEMVIESLDITWLVVTMSPNSIVSLSAVVLGWTVLSS